MRPRRSVATLARQAGEHASLERFVDLEVRMLVADVETLADGTKRWLAGSDQELLRVGGRWDLETKRWSNDAATEVLELPLHVGQREPAVWFAGWMTGAIAGDDALRALTALLVSGRRAGKSHAACVFLVLYAVAFAESIVWTVSPTIDSGGELDRTLRELMPRHWYTRREGNTGRSITYKLRNGSTITLKSGFTPERIKSGRVDLALANELQLLSPKVLANLRGAVADRSGCVVSTCNPGDSVRARFVEDLYLKIKAGDVRGVAFDLDPRMNPWIDYAALAALATEVDSKTFEREVLGRFTAVTEKVLHAYSDVETVRAVPAGLVDITTEVLRRALGRGFPFLVCQDYQATPWQVSLVVKVFADPDDPDEHLAWVVDECIVPDADEYAMLDELESMPRWQATGRVDGECYRGDICGIVGDSSGAFQNGAHDRGATSQLALASRGWKHWFHPIAGSERNPAIATRVQVTNSRLRNHAGVRRLFVAPHCKLTAEAMRRWENKPNGFGPSRTSDYAHACDALGYGCVRLWGKPKREHASGGYSSAGKRGIPEAVRDIDREADQHPQKRAFDQARGGQPSSGSGGRRKWDL